MKSEYFRIGVLTNTHGIKGEFKVYPTTEDMHRYDYLKNVFIENKAGKKYFEVESVKYFKNMVILKLSGIDDIDEALKYKGLDLYVSREDAIPLEEGEYYVSDLIGLKVMTDNGDELGEVKDILQTGANDVYVVKTPEKEVLLPSIPECILKVDLDNETVLVHIMDGLLDL